MLKIIKKWFHFFREKYLPPPAALPITLFNIRNYRDKFNNVICSDELFTENIKITLRGSNNVLKIKPGAKIKSLVVWFDCDNGYLEIGACKIKNKGIRADVRVGLDSRVVIGSNFTCTSVCLISAVERSSIKIGADCMIASGNEIKTDDSHPIFDVNTGKRINLPRDITVGNHVWLARRAVVLGGAKIGDGSVIGYNSVAKGVIPNNCIAVGVPARVIKKDVAWERPHLSMHKPYYKPDVGCVKKSKYWNLTRLPDD